MYASPCESVLRLYPDDVILCLDFAVLLREGEEEGGVRLSTIPRLSATGAYIHSLRFIKRSACRAAGDKNAHGRAVAGSEMEPLTAPRYVMVLGISEAVRLHFLFFLSLEV